jgi:hypothetical protein
VASIQQLVPGYVPDESYKKVANATAQLLDRGSDGDEENEDEDKAENEKPGRVRNQGTQKQKDDDSTESKIDDYEDDAAAADDDRDDSDDKSLTST